MKRDISREIKIILFGILTPFIFYAMDYAIYSLDLSYLTVPFIPGWVTFFVAGVVVGFIAKKKGMLWSLFVGFINSVISLSVLYVWTINDSSPGVGYGLGFLPIIAIFAIIILTPLSAVGGFVGQAIRERLK